MSEIEQKNLFEKLGESSSFAEAEGEHGRALVKDYWRGLEQLAETPEFKEFLHREFPAGASELITESTEEGEKAGDMNRRTFLKLMGASLALAGLSGCRRPVEKIVPYVVAPEEIIPGIAQYYATTMPFGVNAYGMMIKSHEGRPTKIEGNPHHSMNLGTSDAIMQAQILGLYDPDRSQKVLRQGTEATWGDFVNYWQATYPELLKKRGAGMAVLASSFASPTAARLQRDFTSRFPEANWVTYEAVSDENVFDGIKIATGKELRPVYDFAKAKIILSLDADLFLQESDHLLATKGFVAGRRLENEKNDMNRLYVVESQHTITGGMADHRLRLQSRQIPAFAATLALVLNEQGLYIPSGILAGLRPYSTTTFDRVWIRALAKDLMRNSRRSLIVAGRHQPVALQALVVVLNQALANVGTTVAYKPIVDTQLANTAAFGKLVENLKQGRVETLVVLGANPVYNAAADLDFAAAAAKAKTIIHLGDYADETAKVSTWHLPQAHFLESWGDCRSADGTASVVQPLIAPLFAGHSNLELLALLTKGQEQPGYELVRETWKSRLSVGSFENDWQRLLHDGVHKGSQLPNTQISINDGTISQHLSNNQFDLDAATSDRLEVLFQPSSTLFDGRFANNAWLQELPDPVTMLTWDNAVCLSPKTAKDLNVKNEELVQIDYSGRKLEMPVWIVPGQADSTAVLTLGYGRQLSGRIATNAGFNVYTIRTSRAPYIDIGAKISKVGKEYKLATTQLHGSMEGRPLLREGTLEEYRKHPDFAQEMQEIPKPAPLFKAVKYDEGYQWGMAIDLNSCVGCGACTIACQSENNIPVVGKEQVRRGREMQWIRVDRYFAGSPEEAQATFQPVACQHCENAPCEQVCPVAATVHDSEGLNVMTYNRCIGTRYCSNNCPYKVRRFNFLNYTSETPEIVKMAQNPDVTVRFRGVMEKCTFCVQRISGAKLTAKKENRKVHDGELLTACQQACPAEAIVFGDINDANSKVAKIKKQNRNYLLLGELDTKPRNSYLAKIRNPNPEIGV